MSPMDELGVPPEPPIPEGPAGVLMPFTELFLRTGNGYTVYRKDGGGDWVRLRDVVVDPWPPAGIE